jgi:AAA family ATPase
MNGAIEHSTAATHSELVSQPSSIIKEDFQVALRLVHPSLMHELYIEVPKVFWSDIAGSAHVKRKLWEAVELPLKHPNIVSRLNLQLNHGILLYGPPGCSKTMTAKALATESGLNFIAVKGPELVSKYVGESEYKIREIFRKARAASPSVIFFDEIDSIAPNREGGGGHEGLNTVATLLNEMDGVEDVARVLVLAATNRPDAIDPALLRPGRLGTSLYVGPPDYKAILDILTIHTSKMGGIEAHLDLPSVAQNMADNGCFSGADIGAVCDSAGMLCATEAVDGGQLTALALQQRHLEQALLNAEPSLNKTQLKYLSTWRVGKGGQLV